jgi:hypothetical protein
VGTTDGLENENPRDFSLFSIVAMAHEKLEWKYSKEENPLHGKSFDRIRSLGTRGIRRGQVPIGSVGLSG